MILIKKLLAFITVIITFASYGQQNDFNIQLQKTDETCLSNGSITVTVSNAAPSASVLFKLYKLPQTTTPVSVTAVAHMGSLTSGTYKVVAMHSLGSEVTVREKNITINNIITPFNFSLSPSNIYCSTGGAITVNITEGNGVAYEITGGPVIRPLQSSNVFTNLPSGTYIIRAFNNCGVAKVKTYTLILVESTLAISDTYYPEAPSSQCDLITINHLIQPTAGPISYPVTVEYELAPMSFTGTNVTIQQTYSSGAPDSLVVSAVVPRYASQSYSYELRIGDNCGATYTKPGNIVSSAIDVKLKQGILPCAQRYLKIYAYKYKAPFNVEFIQAPAGFNPQLFNTLNLGPFYENTISYGSEGQAIPYGNYIVKITDACGRIAQDSLLVDFEPFVPDAIGVNYGCFSLIGRISVTIPQQYVVSAAIIAGPQTYNAQLPADVTNKINANGVLNVYDLPVGVYTVQITDHCGFSYTVTVEVPPFVERDFRIQTLPDCTPGYGTVHLNGGNGDLTSVIITAAPAAFGHPLPYNASAYIYNGDKDFYMNNLPAGTYSFKGVNICGIEKTKTIDVAGYIPPQNSVTVFRSCGSFAVRVIDNGNGTQMGSYWLQRYNPATNTWGHPVNNTPYTEGTIPTSANSYRLVNHVQRSNLNITGQLRIIKKFETFNNARDSRAVCISVLEEFTFDNSFDIANVYSLACTGRPNDVYIEAQGYNLTYRIEKKNGEVFVVNNGNNNVFTNLEYATYVFSIEDQCGNKETKEVTISEIPSIAQATRPDDMITCASAGSAGTTAQFRLTDQDMAILGPLHSGMHTVSYHLTQQDADNGANPLPEYYTSAYNGQTIYVRLVHNEIDICYGTTSFKLFVGESTIPEITTNGSLCQGEGLYLTAPAGYQGYLWSTGETTRSILIREPGLYSVVVARGYGNRTCDGYGEIEVSESAAPQNVTVQTQDWTDDQNMITVTATGMGNLLYSLDGENWQEDNVFTGLENGYYTVYVKDAGGCGMEAKEVTLLNYPKFFTPNGDGINDTWRIKYSAKEPNMRVTIYDRYGKVVASFGSKSEGWNGTLNNEKLPSTDYWFVVTRGDGRELKGHFAMIR